MKIISTQNAPQAIGPYSQAIIANGMIYTSGQIGLLPNGEMAGNGIVSQANQVLNNLKAVLEAGGSSMGNVIKTTIFLADMDDFVPVNEIYAQHFGSHKPARSTVAAKTLPKNALVEIECIALVE
ncbi:aminoacrylate/iminopropionate hydrolase/deaminase [Sulfurovum sp. enrichment culture clone C5]|uniref:Aminoacrylate/iminopropionate hydrolase/deaminase n=1 Tax=Sulfurovum sp. enrichment culture clone C5 TaxID=497650 RepID=A0A0S4XLL0_9BACT|nr:aminoacrylate/iminopropionate hydrolase/deaminase [Sulfurovum sp. enrichment culture clone C5]